LLGAQLLLKPAFRFSVLMIDSCGVSSIGSP
jgi:hypothetical protein